MRTRRAAASVERRVTMARWHAAQWVGSEERINHFFALMTRFCNGVVVGPFLLRVHVQLQLQLQLQIRPISGNDNRTQA